MFNIISKVNNFLTIQECDSLINYFKKNIKHTDKYRDTIILKHKNEKILERLNNMITFFNFKNVDNMEIVSWPEGSRMKPHYDEGDFLSFLVYLNDDYLGGETIINNIKFKPNQGAIVIFSNGLYLHEVNKIEKGNRYTLIAWYK